MINGLPQGMINITLDGVNIQDNTLRSTDGFFAIVSPRLDAIEEVSVTTAAQGAESAQGAAQIKFVTRSGTNTLSGSVYRVLPARFAERQHLVQQSGRRREGRAETGPVRRQTRGTDRHSRAPGRAQQGVLLLQLRAAGAAQRRHAQQPQLPQRGRRAGHLQLYTPLVAPFSSVNLLELAAANGQLATLDPTVSEAPVRHQGRDGWRLGRGRRQQHQPLFVQRAGPVEAPLPDGPHRLQPHRQPSLQQCLELQLVHRLLRIR